MSDLNGKSFERGDASNGRGYWKSERAIGKKSTILLLCRLKKGLSRKCSEGRGS